MAFAVFGTRAFRDKLPVEPATLAISGAVILIIVAVIPMLMGEPMLTHSHGVFSAFGVVTIKWSTTLLFEIGVVLGISGGLTVAAMKLWEIDSSRERGE